MYFKTLIIILSCDLLFILIAIPLILRRVPPNPVYGFRTRTTLTDNYNWYETNAYFGRLCYFQYYFRGCRLPSVYLSEHPYRVLHKSRPFLSYYSAIDCYNTYVMLFASAQPPQPVTPLWS